MANANGEGSIGYDKKRKRWRARITVQTPDGSRRKSLGWVKTREEAYRTLIEAQSGRPAALTSEARKIMAGEYLDRWLTLAAKHNVGTATFERYEQVVKHDLKPILSYVKLSDLTIAHAEAVKSDMLSRGLAPATVKYSLGVLSNAINRAIDWDLIEKNPVSRVKRPKDRNLKMRPLSEDQAAALINVVRGTRYYAFYLICVMLGLRQGEIAALFWEDINFEPASPTLTVRRSVDTHQAGSRWGETKSGEGRTIDLPETVLGALRAHRKLQSEEQLAARRWDDPRLIFPNQRGGVHRRNSVMRLFHSHLQYAGLPRIRFHDLRHTAATLMLRQGVDVPTVAQILGHADPAITLRRYSWVLKSMSREAARRMDSLGL